MNLSDAQLLADLLRQYSWLPWLLILALLVVAKLVEHGRVRRRNRSLLRALDDSTRSTAELTTSSPAGLLVTIEPAPEPFREFTFLVVTVAYFDPVSYLWRTLTGRHDSVCAHGTLLQPPTAELVWQRGAVPGLAMGSAADGGLWARKQLDIIRSEYATRGANPGAIDHAFRELQTRFGPMLGSVTVRVDGDPHLVVTLASRALSAEDVPALVAGLRALGRAALQR